MTTEKNTLLTEKKPIRRILAVIKTYEDDCTSVGYLVKVRDDGTMRIESRDCWQGHTSGEVWIAPAGESIMDAARAQDEGVEDEEEADVETLIREMLDEVDEIGTLPGARQIRSGYRSQ